MLLLYVHLFYTVPQSFSVPWFTVLVSNIFSFLSVAIKIVLRCASICEILPVIIITGKMD